MAAKKDIIVSIGGKLKEAREKRSLTIEQIQKQTKIHSSVLKALEEGRGDELLTPTYVRSFLKLYAKYLGLDSRELLSEYAFARPERPSETTLDKNSFKSDGPDVMSKFIYGISFALLFIAFLSFATFFWKKVSPFLKKPKAAKVRMLPAATRTKPKAAKPPPAVAQSKITSQFTLLLRVNRPVLVELKKDGVLLFKRLLPKGTVESFTAETKIEMYVGKAEAIELILNGKSLGSPGRGMIKNLEITSQGIRIR